jgi:predicted acyltransferase
MNKDKRLLSLDVLRGLDLFMLVCLQPVIRAILIELDSDALNSTLLYQLDHAEWEGMRVWDLVMPLFLFMSGVTMPYSLPKYKTENGNLKVWVRVIKRFILLFILGIVVQGNILSLDPDRVYLYSNTLQAIATGYLLSVPLVLYLKPKQQIFAILALLVVYSVPMHLYGDWSAQENFACKVDKLILGRFRDGSTIEADGNVLFADWYDYTWLWSSITFCCTVAFGSLAGHITKNGNSNREATARKLLLAGVLLVVVGLIASIGQPIIKRIWTASFTLYSAGWCYLLLALFYWWIDVKGHTKGWEWLLYYGCNAITAYLIGEMINFRSIAESMLYGTAQYLAGWYPVLLTLCNSVILFLILKIMYRNRLFLKV